jgi:hypothetical protein
LRVRRLARLSDSVSRGLRELRPLFAAEEQRLSSMFVDWAEQFRRQAEASGLTTIRAAWSTGRFDRSTRTEGLEFANQVARDMLAPWFGMTESRAEAEYRSAAQRFATMAREHLATLTAEAGVAPDRIGVVPAGTDRFRIGRHFAFSDRMRDHYPRFPWPAFLGTRLPGQARRRRGRAEAYLRDLLLVNSSRVAGDLAERVRESRREVESEIHESLRQVSTAAAEALTWARAVQTRGAEEVRRECGRLEALLAEVEQLRLSAGDRAA